MVLVLSRWSLGIVIISDTFLTSPDLMPPGVNFTNILQAASLDENFFAQLFPTLMIGFVILRQKIIGAKAASKLLVKLNTGDISFLEITGYENFKALNGEMKHKESVYFTNKHKLFQKAINLQFKKASEVHVTLCFVDTPPLWIVTYF